MSEDDQPHDDEAFERERVEKLALSIADMIELWNETYAESTGVWFTVRPALTPPAAGTTTGPMVKPTTSQT